MKTQRRRQKNGVVMIYVLVAMSAMMGFCSLAVDLARVESAKTELRRAADAAALYACKGIADGTAVSKAIQSGTDNKVDGQPLAILPGDVTVGTWSGGAFTAGGTSPNAVRVKAYRTKARNSAISLVFAQLIGQSSCDVTTTAIAEITSSDSTQYVAATSNPYLAGEPTGTRASVPDPGYKGPKVNPEHPWQYDWAGPTGSKLPSGQAYGSPVQFPVTLSPGTVLQLTNVTGQATNDPTLPLVDANGQFPQGGDLGIYDDEAAEATGSEHGMSNIQAPLNSFIGVFLDDNVPDDDGPIPPELDFGTSTEQNYTSISPELRQPFYIGNGQTSDGEQQSVVVPKGATRFYIATMDGHEWSNNVGGFTATISTSHIRLVQ
jgi:hypothetical protein